MSDLSIIQSTTRMCGIQPAAAKWLAHVNCLSIPIPLLETSCVMTVTFCHILDVLELAHDNIHQRLGVSLWG